MQTKKKLSLRVSIVTICSILLAAILVISGIGIYLKVTHKEKPAEVNPLDFSFDKWDGTTIDTINFNENYANRGTKTKTINSAASFIHFINEVNAGSNFEGYTVYLNSNIDMAGYSISPIGNSDFKFKGTFDGSHYSILNAKINGNALFTHTQNATVKNLGLYNCTFAEDGAVVGVAKNTNLENIYVRLGNGTLVNEYVSNEGTHEIKNSFVDSSASGLIKKLNTNSSQENEVAISNCYFTNGDEVIIEKVGNTFEVLTNVIKATNKADFAEWSYSKSYSSMVDWCDYDYLAGSKKLDFVYPLQSGFVKVFLTGSCYESVMVAGDTVVDATNLKMAFSEADKNQEAEVNLLVEKIFMEARAQVQNNTNIKVNALKDTTIIRGENNEDSLFVAAGGAKITIGEDAEEVGVAGGRSTSPTITIDGNRDYIEKNKLESGAVVVSYGAEVELKENVVIKNNINNNVKYGGAVLLFNTAAKSTIDATFENCYAENGGGAVCVVGTTVNSLGSAYNCSTKGKGGVAYFTNELPQSSTQAMRTLYGKGLNVQPIEDPEAGELEDGFNISTSSYYYSYGSMDADGGVFYCEGTLTISGAPHFDGGGCANGGAIYATNLIITGNPIFEANNVDTKGGAIYVAEDLIISGSPLFDGNSSNGDGGAIYAGGDVTISGSPKFTSNSSGDRGGAVAADNTTFASTSSAEFNENFADLGGAIYSYNDIEISGNPIFDENGAAKSGSAIDCEGTLTISGNPTFSNHGDYNLGTCGAINVWSSVEISGNPTFIGNRGDYYTDNHAAAIYSDGVVNITGNPLFSGNFSVYNGVIYAAGDVTVSGAPSFIENNTNGIGAIKSDSKITISGDADFYANSAGDWGVISAPTVIISGNPNFVDNPSNAPCNMGGGISASTLVEISGSPTFINCYTDDGQGGAIYSEGDVVISGNPTFAGNKLGTYDGGAIYAYNNVIVSGSPTFEGYKASSRGGAIYSKNDVIITGSPTFDGNEAKNQGGAIYATNVIITGSPTFDGNTASYNGGAIYATKNVFVSNMKDFATGENLDTGYNLDWNSNFTIETTFMVTELNKRYFIFGDYHGDNVMNVEVNQSNYIRLYFKRGESIIDKIVSDDTVTANSIISVKLVWQASTNRLEFSANNRGFAGAEEDFYIYSTLTDHSILSGVKSNRTLKIGAADSRVANSPFGPIFTGEIAITDPNGTHVFNTQPDVVNTPRFVGNVNAIYAMNGIDIYNSNVKFNSNTNVMNANAACLESVKIYINADCEFINNQASYGDVVSSPRIELRGNSVFANNTSGDMGNVVSGITVYIYDSPKFINNSAYEKGGAVYARTLRIPGSPLFEGNYVQSGNGGAVYATDAYIYGNPVFKDNVAINGSAIYVSYYLFLGKNDIENADFGETFPDAVVTLENNHGEELSYSEASGQIAFGYIFYLYGSIQNESTMSIDYAHPNIYLGEDQYVSCNHHEINQNGNMISVYKAGVKTDGVLDVCNIIYADNNGIPEPDREIFQVVNVSYSQYEVKHYGYDGGYVQPRETSIAKEFTFYNTSATVYPGETAYFYFYAPHRFGTVWAMYDQGNAYIYQLVEVTRGEDGYGRFGMCFGESGTYSFYFDCEGDYINEQYPTPTKTGWVEMTVLPQPLLTFENEKIELKDYSSGDEGERTITQNISIDSSLNFGYLKFTSGNTNIVTVPQEKVAVASDYKLEMTIKKEGGTQITVEYFKSQNDQTPLATKTFTVYAGEMSVDIKVKSNKFTVDGWMTTGDNVNVEITLTPGEHNRDLSFAVNAEGAYMGIHSEGVLWDQSYANGVIFEPQRGRGEYVIKFWAWESGAGVEYEDGTYVVNVVNPLIYKEYVVHVVDYVAPIPTNSTTPMIFNGDYDRPCPGNWNSHINAGDTSGMFDCWLDYNYHAGTHTAYVEGLPWNEDYDHMWAWEDGTHENKPWTYTILPKKLTTPTGIGFYDSMISFASINEDPYYFQYKINLYKDNALYRTIMHDVEDCPLMFDIPITITGAGAYSFTVQAVSQNQDYIDSDVSMMSNYSHFVGVRLVLSEGIKQITGDITPGVYEFLLPNGNHRELFVTLEEGYRWVGWTCDSANITISESYGVGSIFIAGNYVMGDHTAVLRANAEYDGYTVKFDVNNSDYGELTLNEVLVPTNSTITTEGNKLYVGDYEIYAIATADTVQYSYKFVNWSGVVSNVTRELLIMANFERTINQYTINFDVTKIWHDMSEPDGYYNAGTLSHTSLTVPYGTRIEFVDNVVMVGATAVRVTSNNYSGYQFKGWHGKVSNFVDSNITLTAYFENVPGIYTVTFNVNNPEYGYLTNGVDEDNTTFSFEVEIVYDYNIHDGDESASYGVYWEYDSNALVIYDSMDGQMNEESIIFPINNNSSAQYHYNFVGWMLDGELLDWGTYEGNCIFEVINRNMSLTAVFEPVGREYTVSFESENSNYGKVSTSSFKANYGEKIKIVDNMIVIGNSSVIAIANDRTVQYEYSFAGWKMKNGSAVGTTVDGAMTIVATFAQTERTYTVTLAVNNAELGTIENYTLPIAATYGAKIKVEDYKITIGETTYIATPADGYTFEKWTGIVGSVNGNITITAVFSTAGDWAAVKFDMQEGVLISGFDGNVMFVPNGESVEISGTTIKIGETTITVAVNDGYRIIELESSTGTINGSVTITIEAVKVCEVRVKLDGHYGFEEFETIYVESGTIVSQKDSTDPVLTIGEHEFYATYIEWNVNRVSINGNTVSSIDGYVITDDVTIIVDLYISLA